MVLHKWQRSSSQRGAIAAPADDDADSNDRCVDSHRRCTDGRADYVEQRQSASESADVDAAYTSTVSSDIGTTAEAEIIGAPTVEAATPERVWPRGSSSARSRGWMPATEAKMLAELETLRAALGEAARGDSDEGEPSTPRRAEVSINLAAVAARSGAPEVKGLEALGVRPQRLEAFSPDKQVGTQPLQPCRGVAC